MNRRVLPQHASQAHYSCVRHRDAIISTLSNPPMYSTSTKIMKRTRGIGITTTWEKGDPNRRAQLTLASFSSLYLLRLARFGSGPGPLLVCSWGKRGKGSISQEEEEEGCVCPLGSCPPLVQSSGPYTYIHSNSKHVKLELHPRSVFYRHDGVDTWLVVAP